MATNAGSFLKSNRAVSTGAICLRSIRRKVSLRSACSREIEVVGSSSSLSIFSMQASLCLVEYCFRFSHEFASFFEVFWLFEWVKHSPALGVFSFFASGTVKFVDLLGSVAAIKFSTRSRFVNSHMLPSSEPSAPTLLRFVQMTDPVQCSLSILTTSFPSR